MSEAKPIKIITYQTTKAKLPFDQWISKLDKVTALKIFGRIQHMASGTLGDCKNVGGGVLEARVDIGPGYRIYFALAADGTIIVLLCGGNKSSQKSDIERAKQFWLDYKERT